MIKQRTSKKQGDVGIGAAIAYFTAIGCTVCIPLTDSQEYDLVVDNDGLKRVQIKTTTSPAKYGGYNVMLKTCGGTAGKKVVKFDNTKSDLLFVLTDNGDRYLIPSKDITATNAIIVGNKYQEYKI